MSSLFVRSALGVGSRKVSEGILRHFHKFLSVVRMSIVRWRSPVVQMRTVQSVEEVFQ